jgi:hypothetical protein
MDKVVHLFMDKIIERFVDRIVQAWAAPAAKEVENRAMMFVSVLLKE